MIAAPPESRGRATIRTNVAALKTQAAWCAADGHLDVNQLAGHRLPPEPEVRPFADSEVVATVGAIHRHEAVTHTLGGQREPIGLGHMQLGRTDVDHLGVLAHGRADHDGVICGELDEQPAQEGRGPLARHLPAHGGRGDRVHGDPVDSRHSPQ